MTKLKPSFEFIGCMLLFALAGFFLGEIREATTEFSCIIDLVMFFDLGLLALSYL
jgi:hypothetical protein